MKSDAEQIPDEVLWAHLQEANSRILKLESELMGCKGWKNRVIEQLKDKGLNPPVERRSCDLAQVNLREKFDQLYKELNCMADLQKKYCEEFKKIKDSLKTQ